MNEEKLKLIVQNLLTNDFGREYLKYLIIESGCLDRSINFENVNKEYYLKGKKELGHVILNDIKKFSYKDLQDFI